MNADRETVLKIKGPCWTCKFCDVEFNVSDRIVSAWPCSIASIVYVVGCHVESSSFCYLQVLSADGTQDVGKITKQWSGLAKEYFTDADNFGIQCELFSSWGLYQLFPS